jgi:predicted DNA-binding transcriptional regulator YafY
MALAFSRQLLTPLQGTLIAASLNSALTKINAAIPSEASDYVQRLDQWFSVGLGPHKHYRRHRETIDRLSQAIAHRHTVQMRYFSAGRNASTRREVDPYRLRYVDGGLYLIAYCHLRKDVRMFAVERIKSLTPTDHPYQMPLHFDLDAYVEDALVVMRGERITAELKFDKATAAWAKDRIWHPSQQTTKLKNGQVADTRELLGWILSFGSGVHVLKPDRLQTAIREEARKLLAQ